MALRADGEGEGDRRRAAYRFIVLMGVVSFFGDITYEAAKSVTGPYLALLGGGAAVVGFVAGFGQFVGYALRILSGWYADRTERYWIITIAGYAFLLLLPLLAFAWSWPVAAALLIGERIGKAVRTPARDAIISHASREVGRGRAFGLHEFMDKIGSMAGPLIFAAVFFFQGGYRLGFTLLWIPALLTVAILLLARARIPLPGKFESDGPVPGDGLVLSSSREERGALPSLFRAYAVFTFLAVAGFATFPLMAFHFKVKGFFSDGALTLLYALAMGVDAMAALAIGHAYDRKGLPILAAIPLLSVATMGLAFAGGAPAAAASLILWGVVMAVHETVMRAAIGDLTTQGQRGLAYGVFNTIYGAAWFLGGSAMGFIYDRISPAAVAAFCLVLEAASLPFLAAVRRGAKSRK